MGPSCVLLRVPLEGPLDMLWVGYFGVHTGPSFLTLSVIEVGMFMGMVHGLSSNSWIVQLPICPKSYASPGHTPKRPAILPTYMRIFKHQGPYYRPQNNRDLIVRTPTKRDPNLQKQPHLSLAVYATVSSPSKAANLLFAGAAALRPVADPVTPAAWH